MSSEQIPENNTPPVETPKTETPTETTQTPETKTEGLVSSTTSSTVQTAKSWKETISEEYRNDPNIAKFTEIDALAKSYINATRMIGTDKVAIPNKNFTEDQWNEFYDKVGRPETPDKYNLYNPWDYTVFSNYKLNDGSLDSGCPLCTTKSDLGVLTYTKWLSGFNKTFCSLIRLIAQS